MRCMYERLLDRQGFFPMIVPECSLRVQATHWTVVHHLEVYFVPHKLTDVVDAVLDHGGPVVKRVQSVNFSFCTHSKSTYIN